MRGDCRRFTTRPGGRQDYFTEVPYDPDSESCREFLVQYTPTEEDIRVHAYYLWRADGSPQGFERDYWLRAETELRH